MTLKLTDAEIVQRGRDLDRATAEIQARLDRRIEEKEKVVRALKGWEFMRDRHGSLYDRGSADSYYGRSPDPHYGGVGGDSGMRVKVMYKEAVEEYMAGYRDNEDSGSKKDYY